MPIIHNVLSAPVHDMRFLSNAAPMTAALLGPTGQPGTALQTSARAAGREAIRHLNRFSPAKLLPLSQEIFATNKMPFKSHRGDGPFDTALAMNVPYDPIRRLRAPIVAVAGSPDLKFFTGWEAEGEAHATIITPVEFDKVLRPAGITIDEIEEIALRRKIQNSDMKILGLGHGVATNADGSPKPELGETFFLVVESENHLAIRAEIEALYLRKGGAPGGFKAKDFYGHITVGYRVRDLHIQDGVIKDRTSLDRRFSTVIY